MFAKTFCLHTQRCMAHSTPFSDDSGIIEHFLLRCDDPVNVSFGSLADLHSPTGYEPKDLAEEYNPVQVKPKFLHRPGMTSTNDSAERIATPSPESDLDDEQIGTLLASPLYLQDREAGADRSRVCHSLRENSVSDREDFSSEHQHFSGNNEHLPSDSQTRKIR